MRKAPAFLAVLFFLQIAVAAPLFAEEKKEIFDPLKKLQEAFTKKNQPAVFKKSIPKESQIAGLRLEGVARGAHGGSDVAILNGEPYRVGDVVKGHRISEIHPSYIEVENETTHAERIVWVNGKPSDAEKDVLDSQKEPFPS